MPEKPKKRAPLKELDGDVAQEQRVRGELRVQRKAGERKSKERRTKSRRWWKMMVKMMGVDPGGSGG